VFGQGPGVVYIPGNAGDQLEVGRKKLSLVERLGCEERGGRLKERLPTNATGALHQERNRINKAFK